MFVAHMQHMIFEVFEFPVRRLCALQININMLEEQTPPAVGLLHVYFAQGVKRQLVMAAIGLAGVDDFEQHRHGVSSRLVGDTPELLACFMIRLVLTLF